MLMIRHTEGGKQDCTAFLSTSFNAWVIGSSTIACRVIVQPFVDVLASCCCCDLVLVGRNGSEYI